MSNPAAYLDYHASTPMDRRVAEAMLEAFAAPGNASSDEHAFGWKAACRLAAARELVASAIGASADEVIFTSGATEANNMAIRGAALAAPPTRRRVLISAFEHKSVLEPVQSLAAAGYDVEFIPIGPDGLVNMAALEGMLADDVAVVSVMAVNNEIGTIQPISSIANLTREVGAFFHVDGTQALAAMKVDVVGWGGDSVSFSGHKVYGPLGVGAMYLAVDAPWRPVPLMQGGGQENGLRPGTVAVPLCVGLAEACRLLLKEGETERSKVASIRDSLEQAIRSHVPEAEVTCTGTPRHPGSLHIRFPGVAASDLLTRVQPRVGAATGSACTSGVIGPSHVLMAIGMTPEVAEECIRFSVGRFSTEDDIAVAADALGTALRMRAA